MKPKWLSERRDHTEEGRTTQAAPGTTARDWDATAAARPGPSARLPRGTREQSHRGQKVTADSGLHGFACLPTLFCYLKVPQEISSESIIKKRGIFTKNEYDN